jgi:hypothetical protein
MRLNSRAFGTVPKKPDRPVLQRLFVNDATAEALVPILKENPRGVALVRDELVGWVQAMNQYREGGKGADQQFFLSAWSGAAVSVDRKKTHDQGPLRVPRPFIGVVGGLTPDKLSTLRGGRPGQKVDLDGFIDRILLAYPPEPPAAGENWLEVAGTTLKDLARAMEMLLTDLEMVPVQEGDVVKSWRPFVVRLTVCGRRQWHRFTHAHAAEVNAEDFPQHLRGPWSKLKGYCARFALIVHCLRLVCNEVHDADVDGESMARAIRLTDYFKAHARKVYAALDADQKVADARRVLRCLARHRLTSFTRRDLYQHLRRHFGRPDALDAPLKVLGEHGYLRVATPASAAARRGHPTERYEVNPLWERPGDRTQGTQRSQSPPRRWVHVCSGGEFCGFCGRCVRR